MSDNSEDDGGELTFDADPFDPVLYVRDTDPMLQLFGHGTDSDENAHLNCSACGEQVKAVTTEKENQFEIGPEIWVNVVGFVCGCRETPKNWNVNSVDGKTED